MRARLFHLSTEIEAVRSVVVVCSYLPILVCRYIVYNFPSTNSVREAVGGVRPPPQGPLHGRAKLMHAAYTHTHAYTP